MITTRKAELADVQAILALWLESKANSLYATVKLDRARALKSIRQCVSGPQAFARVAVTGDGTVIGVLLGLKEELWFSPSVEAKDLIFLSRDPVAQHQLLQEFCTWAWTDGRVVSVLMAAPDQGVSMFDRLGFTREGAVYCLGRWDAVGKVA